MRILADPAFRLFDQTTDRPGICNVVETRSVFCPKFKPKPRRTQLGEEDGLAVEIDSIRPCAYRTTDKVFPHLPRIERFKLDLKAASIPYEDDLGRFADFHALRYTFATFLTVSDAGQRVTQELMRHSDPELTAGLYTDASQLPLRAAVESIPWLGYPQIGAQISDSDRQSLARVVESWPRLNESLKLAILAIVEAVNREGGGK